MHLLYLIKCHQLPLQLGRLLRSIYTTEHTYYIHVDRKAPAPMKVWLADFVRNVSNVRLFSSHRCLWGGWSFVAIDLEAMAMAERHGDKFDMFVTLSGADFPLKSQAHIADFFSKNRDKSFLSYSSDLSIWLKPEERVQKVYLELPWRNKLWKCPLLKRSFPKQWTRFGGADWVNLHRSHCDYLLHDARAKDIRQFYQYTRLPGEGYYQTALLNGPLREQVVNADLREIQWPPNSAHPRIFRSSDWELLRTSAALFGRKFDPRVDEAIITNLEEHLGINPARPLSHLVRD